MYGCWAASKIEDLVSEPRVLVTAEAIVSEVVQTLAAGSLGVAVVSDDERYGLHGMAIVTAGQDLRFELYAAWDPTHFAAATIATWAENLARFTSR